MVSSGLRIYQAFCMCYKTTTTLKYTVDDIPLYCRIYNLSFKSMMIPKKLCMHSYDILFPLND